MADVKFSDLTNGTDAFGDEMVGIPAAGGSAQLFDREMTTAVKKTDETINSDDTLTDDADLVLAVRASKQYSFYMYLAVTWDTVPEMKITFSVPSGTTMRSFDNYQRSNVAVASRDMTATETFSVGTIADWFVVKAGRILTSTTAGNINFQWAQGTSDAAGTTLQAGSSFTIWEEA